MSAHRGGHLLGMQHCRHGVQHSGKQRIEGRQGGNGRSKHPLPRQPCYDLVVQHEEAQRCRQHAEG